MLVVYIAAWLLDAVRCLESYSWEPALVDVVMFDVSQTKDA